MGRTPSDGVNKRQKSSAHRALDLLTVASQQRQHQDWDSLNPFEMLDNTGSELDNLMFDPTISTSDGIDFSGIDNVHFEVEDDSLDLAFPRLVVAQNTLSSPIASQALIQPRQQRPQPRLQTMQLSSASSSTISQGFEDSNIGPSQTPSMPTSSPDAVQYWTAQLEELSQLLQKSPVPLDGVLRISSQLLPHTSEVLRSLHPAHVPSFATSLILILVCLAQTATLFEQCVPSVLSDRPIAGSSDLSLRLGEFRVDRKAQQMLQIHIVSQELSSMLQVFKLIRQTLSRPDWCKASKRTHNTLLEDLQVRIETLVDQIK
jgi:hypothetical protein